MGVKTAGVGHFTIPTAPAAGTSVTSGSANVFTTNAVQLIASTSAALYITGVHVESSAALAATYICVQLMTGGAGSETVIGQYLVPLSTASTVALGYRQIYPFIPVAASARIAVKTADSVGAKATLVTIECIAQSNVVDDGIAVTSVTTVGSVTGNVGGNVVGSVGSVTAAVSVTGDLSATMKTSVTTAATAATPTVTLANGAHGGAAATMTLGGAGGLTATHTGNVTGSVGSVTARVTANTDQLAGQTVTAAAGVTFPTSVASPTNITAGTITTVTNLTNAPTAGDLTATMKASVTTAATAATPTAAAVTAGVTLAANQHVIVDSGTVTTLTNLPAITAGWLTAAGIAASALNGKGDWNIGKTGYTLTQAFPTNFSSMSLTAGGLVTLAGVTHTGAVIPTVSAVTGLTASNLDAAVSTRLASASYTAPLDAAGTRTAVGLATANLDTQLLGISSKTDNLPADPADASDIAASFTTVNTKLDTIDDYMDTEVAAIKAKTDNLPAVPASQGDVTTVGTAVADVAATLGTPAGLDLSADVAAVKADTAGVKTKTDQLAFTVAGQVDGNIKSVAGTTVSGAGTEADPWGP